MSSSRGSRTTRTMGERREVKIGGRRRRAPGDLLRQEEVLIDQGTTGAVGVATATEAGVLGEEMIDEETVLKGEPLTDVITIEPDDMVDSRRGATTSRGTIRGRSHADSAHSSGPHWPQEKTGSIAARDLLLLRIG